jgi:hypothetical protein
LPRTLSIGFGTGALMTRLHLTTFIKHHLLLFFMFCDARYQKLN